MAARGTVTLAVRQPLFSLVRDVHKRAARARRHPACAARAGAESTGGRVAPTSQYGPDVSARGSDPVAERRDARHAAGITLHDAVLHGLVDEATLLLDRGEDVDQTDSHSRTPLYVACREGYVDAATLMLDRGAAVDRAQADEWAVVGGVSAGPHRSGETLP